MPEAPEHYCNHPSCSRLVRGRSKCPDHTAEARAASDAERPRKGRRYDRQGWRGPGGIRNRQFRRERLCRMCRAAGKLVVATDVDHIVPLEEGGTDAPSNLQSLCHAHHSRKTAVQDGGFGRPAEGGEVGNFPL